MANPKEIKELYKQLREFEKGVKEGERLIRCYAATHYEHLERAIEDRLTNKHNSDVFKEGLRLVIEELY